MVHRFKDVGGDAFFGSFTTQSGQPRSKILAAGRQGWAH
jgi:hypothetical protein